MVVRNRYPVAYEGPRAVTAPATWGQRGMWYDVRRMGAKAAVYNLARAVPVPPGLEMDGVLDAISELLGRYEALRTVFCANAAGDLEQRVLRRGRIDVEVWTADPGEDERELAVLADGLAPSVLFDHAAGPPVHIAVLAVRDVPRQVRLTLSHMAVDGASAAVVCDALAELMAAAVMGDPPPPAPPARQPVEHALFERSPEGRRMNARALAFQADRLAEIPRTMFPVDPLPAAEPRFWRGVMTSRAAAMSMDLLAARYSAGGSAVLLAAVAVLLGRLTGMDRVGLNLVADNRGAATRRSVAHLVQDSPVVIDVSGGSFGRIVRRSALAAALAYQHGHHDRMAAQDLTVSVGRERGTGGIDVSCFYNDLRRRESYSGPAAAVPAAVPAVRDAMAGTGFDWVLRYEQDHLKLYVTAFGEPGELKLGVGADTCYVPPPVIQTYALGVERLLAEVAAGTRGLAAVLASTGIGAPVRAGRWAMVDGCWVSLDAVERLLARVVPGAVSRAVTTRTPDGDRLTVYLAGARVPPADVHLACLARVSAFPTALAPHRYVMCAAAPADPSDDMAWAVQPAGARYTSRPDSPAPAGPREPVWAEAPLQGARLLAQPRTSA